METSKLQIGDLKLNGHNFIANKRKVSSVPFFVLTIMLLMVSSLFMISPTFAFSQKSETVVTVPNGRYARSPNPTCIEHGGPDASARCANLCVSISPFATIDRVEIFMKEARANSWVKTAGNQEPIGWAKFVGSYQVKPSHDQKEVCWLFMNWKHDRYRQAKMIVYYSR